MTDTSTNILVSEIEGNDGIDPVTKLLALSEIDLMQRGYLQYADYVEFTPVDNIRASRILGALFIWSGTENGHTFWEQIEQKLKFSEKGREKE